MEAREEAAVSMFTRLVGSRIRSWPLPAHLNGVGWHVAAVVHDHALKLAVVANRGALAHQASFEG